MPADSSTWNAERPPSLAELKAFVLGRSWDGEAGPALADELDRVFVRQPPEAVKMLTAILRRGSRLGPGDGWFGPGQSRYTFAWLANLHGRSANVPIARGDFRGTQEQFAALDRNRDGLITADDLDWSDGHPFVQQSSLIVRLFRQLDADGDGRVGQIDLEAFRARLAGKHGSFTANELCAALLASGGGLRPGDAPTTAMLLTTLFNNELGSLSEGPAVGDPAPDVKLVTADGSRSVHLAEELGSGPVVLFFGNFTCAPYRVNHALVDGVRQRWDTHARFFGIYVREAHPADGWHMETNSAAGISLPQPKTMAERASVAQRCSVALRYSMPLLVDDMEDSVGNAYSGMPSRLYVIDAAGRIAYKAGRGPFGLKVGEMEQALVMALLESDHH